MRDSACDLSSVWIRVDDRLIHGQVAVGWWHYLRYAEIWVVDDLVLGDPYLQDALRLAAPTGVQVRVYGVEEVGALLAPSVKRQASEGVTRACRVLLLVRSPETALALVEGGAPLTRVNVGNLSAQPGSVRVFKNISLTRVQADDLDVLAGRGVRITFQLTPEDSQADWQAVRRRLTS